MGSVQADEPADFAGHVSHDTTALPPSVTETLSLGKNSITLEVRLAPGPDYKLYLSPEFVESEVEFARVKPRMVRVNDIRDLR